MSGKNPDQELRALAAISLFFAGCVMLGKPIYFWRLIEFLWKLGMAVSIHISYNLQGCLEA